MNESSPQVLLKFGAEMSSKKDQKGFSLPELLIVLFVIAIIVVLALPQIMSSRRMFRFAGVQRQVVTVLREARQEAIAQRAAVTFRYDDTGKKLIIFGGKFGAAGTVQNQIHELYGNGLPQDDIIYGRPAGASTAALGDTTNLASLSAGKVDITFQTDGSVVDASNNPQNKAIFFYDNQSPAESAFAVSVLGAGGRAKLWRYSSGVNMYVE
jgi:prepilin-type N-terminal cleavage/methylation domain-containing protein